SRERPALALARLTGWPVQGFPAAVQFLNTPAVSTLIDSRDFAVLARTATMARWNADCSFMAREGNGDEVGRGRGNGDGSDDRVHGARRRASPHPLQPAALAPRAARGARAGLLLPDVHRERDDPFLRGGSHPGCGRGLLGRHFWILLILEPCRPRPPI